MGGFDGVVESVCNERSNVSLRGSQRYPWGRSEGLDLVTRSGDYWSTGSGALR